MPAPADLAPPRRDRIWVADDSPLELAQTKLLLSSCYDVEGVADGSLLLERLARPDVLPPDLIVLDWRMPSVSGLEVCRFLRASPTPTHAALPIVVLTGSTHQGDLEEAFAAGANDFVAKPVRAPELLARVRTQLQVRRHAEEATADRARLAALLEALTHQSVFGVAIFRGEHLVFERANAAYRQVVGDREVEGKALLDALPELAGQGFDALIHGVRRTGVPFIGREILVHLDRHGGGVIEDAYFDVVYQPVRSPTGQCVDVLVILHDVTDAVSARQEAERLGVLQHERATFEQQLIGIVSHDLRNPLTAIHLGAQILELRGDVFDARTRKTVGNILNSSDRATRLVADLLDFTKVRLGGGLQIDRKPMDLHQLVTGTLAELEAAHPTRTITFLPTGDATGEWGADRITQVVTNLVVNALKYSPVDSSVEIATRGELGKVTLSVHNWGPAIPKHLLGRLFKPMSRLEGAPETADRSVGLGLYIVKHIVEAHGGVVRVHSTPSEGTTFTVELERRPIASA